MTTLHRAEVMTTLMFMAIALWLHLLFWGNYHRNTRQLDGSSPLWGWMSPLFSVWLWHALFDGRICPCKHGREYLNAPEAQVNNDPLYIPRRGDDVETWLKRWRDSFGVGYSRDAADYILDDYRLHADTRTPLYVEVREHD